MAALSHDVYVWQRSWNAPVKTAVLSHGTNFGTVVALAAEVTWKNKQPQVARPALPYETLRAGSRRVGLALRIGPSAGPFSTNDPTAKALAGLAHSIVSEARSNGIEIAELQLDFDCAESRLDGYRLWVEAVKLRIAPTALIITALPAWLRQPSFSNLVAASDGFILQVHSLERPKNFNAPFTLCDPASARSAAEKASRANVPFRVALPTYGYYVAFDQNHSFIGLAADGPSIKWPAGTRIREVRTNPEEMARLVSFWTTNQPKNMRGVIWYRLPIESEILNWRFSTLGVVMACRVPQADLRVESRSSEPELAEIFLRNAGSADFSGNARVTVRIPRGQVRSSDAVGGFDLEKTGGQSFLLRSAQLFLRAGEEREIGWLRTERKVEVELELINQSQPPHEAGTLPSNIP